MNADTAGVDLSGQVALITGGGRGLGRAAAQTLAEAGMSVVVAARSQHEIAETAEIVQSAGGKALAIPVDVADPASVDTMIEQVIREFGQIDLLVNNAGIIQALGPIWETNVQEWKQVLDIDLYGCYLCARAALKHMVARRQGRIINVGSYASVYAVTRCSAYCAAKTGLARLTECIADDASEYGITAFTIDPGTVVTAMAEYLMESEAGRAHTPWFREMILAGGHVPADLFTGLVLLAASGKADALSSRFLAVGEDMNRMIENAEPIRAADMYMLRLKELPQTVNLASDTST